MTVTNTHLKAWVDECAKLCKPDRIQWCDGSEAEKQALLKVALETGDLIALDQKTMPGCYLHRSAQNDVARTENLTFICCPSREDAGPTNNWMAPAEAYDKLGKIFDGAMKGRTMYVVPFLLGPKGSPFSRVGVEITDSVYVALNMGIMTRMGQVALDHLGASNDFTRCLHSNADLDINRRFICHFPQDNTVWSVGSGYGGNALLSKKCFALRLASDLGRREGWLAEHMLILGLEDPRGNTTYIAAAFPSACGKTNLAMMVPPPEFKGWKVWTVGDDIAWLRPGPDGRLWAINPEAGFFGVAPGTGQSSNPNALAMLGRNAIFTNVAQTKDNTVWWEGLGDPPAEALDWKGETWTPASGTPAAHPNARFTVPLEQCPTYSPKWNDPQGVPISAILFGARRATVVPLVYESFNWKHGVFLGATLASETTAAATGAVGVLRRDPFAMLPFCGYNMGDYFGHWLEMGAGLSKPPQIFRVNWFLRGADRKFLWPGFGQNLRVLQWIIDRCQGKADAVETPIGMVPARGSLDLQGTGLGAAQGEKLFEIDVQGWSDALRSQEEFFDRFGEHLPAAMHDEHCALARRLEKARLSPAGR
jgi:phosphoenolpyruvate carboxykinase (GTP)